MKGVVLAGGLGTRLRPMTRVVNKHLLPVYDRPMIFYPLDALQSAGVREVCIVVGGREPEEIRELVGDGVAWGFERVEYARQSGEGGIADALRCAEPFVRGAPMCVILGDNIIQDSLERFAEEFGGGAGDAMVLLSAVDDPERFGVPRFDAENAIVEIVEKPAVPTSSLAVVGIYFYRPDVFDVITRLEPSTRGELEITDVNNEYARRGTLRHGELTGFWADAGTAEGLFRASLLVREWRGAGTAALGTDGG